MSNIEKAFTCYQNLRTGMCFVVIYIRILLANS